MRVDCKRAINFDQRGVELPHLQERGRVVGERVHGIRPDGDRAFEAGERILVPAQPGQRNAADAKSIREQRIDPDGFAEQILSLVKLLALEIDQPKTIEGVEMPRIGAQNLVVQAPRFRELSRLIRILRALQSHLDHGAECVVRAPTPLQKSEPDQVPCAASGRRTTSRATTRAAMVTARLEGLMPDGMTTIFTSFSTCCRR